MAFEKKTWTDRVAEFINRRVLTKEDGSTELVTVARSEGTISQEGDAFNAKNMNDLEQRVAEEFGALNDALSIISGILVAGETSITLISDRIKADGNFIAPCTTVWGVSPTAITCAEGSVTLTYDAQDADVEVGVQVIG